VFHTSKQRGDDAEKLAKEYLLKQGLKPVTENFRCKQGEVDLIMTDRDTLVFIEVRYRKNTLYGTPAATVGHNKQAKLIRAAGQYLMQQKRQPQCRFDVVAITAHPELTIEWIQDAFFANA
jgi:putative endonuclease